MCVLISPPKIFGAVCSVNSMTRGSWLCLMKSSSFSLVISPSKLFRPSSNCGYGPRHEHLETAWAPTQSWLTESRSLAAPPSCLGF